MSLYYQRNKHLKLFPDQAFASKYLLGKSGSDMNHVAPIAGQADEPAYVVNDSTRRSGVDFLDVPLGCEILGLGGETAWAESAGVISDGDDIVSFGNGQVASLQTLTNAGVHGQFWKIGVARGDSCTGGALGAADGIQFVSDIPVQVNI